MVSEARKLAKRLGARLRKSEKQSESEKSVQLFGMGSIMNHIKTNWVEVKKNVTLTSLIRNNREGLQGH
jgi:hypothetical protein